MNSNIVPPRTEGPRPRIVLVEDDPGVRRSIQLLLQRNYDVRSYASSAALLAEPAPADVACLVTDYRMAEMDGLEVLRAFRACGWTGPAILITAYYSPELVERARREGCDIVLDKPLREHALVEAVAQLTGRLRPNGKAFSTA